MIGDSAGGYLAQMVGVTGGDKEYDQGDYLDQSSEVQAAATIYGISNLMNIGEGYSKEIQDIHASRPLPRRCSFTERRLPLILVQAFLAIRQRP